MSLSDPESSLSSFGGFELEEFSAGCSVLSTVVVVAAAFFLGAGPFPFLPFAFFFVGFSHGFRCFTGSSSSRSSLSTTLGPSKISAARFFGSRRGERLRVTLRVTNEPEVT